MDSERFSEKRFQKCMDIRTAIMKNWETTNSLSYIVRATDSVHGISLDELRKRYFAVGVNDNLTEIPFIDLLVVFSMIEQELEAIREREKSSGPSKIKYQVSTHWPDEEAVQILSNVVIETPFDEGKNLRILARHTDEPPEDD